MSGNSWANMGQECIKCHINVYPHKQVGKDLLIYRLRTRNALSKAWVRLREQLDMDCNMPQNLILREAAVLSPGNLGWWLVLVSKSFQ